MEQLREAYLEDRLNGLVPTLIVRENEMYKISHRKFPDLKIEGRMASDVANQFKNIVRKQLVNASYEEMDYFFGHFVV